MIVPIFARCCTPVVTGEELPPPTSQEPFIGSNSPRFNPQVNTDIRYGLGINLDSTVGGQLSGDEYQRVGRVFKFYLK